MHLEIHPPLPAMEAKLVDSVPVGDEWHEATVRTLADPTRTTMVLVSRAILSNPFRILRLIAAFDRRRQPDCQERRIAKSYRRRSNRRQLIGRIPHPLNLLVRYLSCAPLCSVLRMTCDECLCRDQTCKRRSFHLGMAVATIQL
jgi:hypothetical protein